MNGRCFFFFLLLLLVPVLLLCWGQGGWKWPDYFPCCRDARAACTRCERGGEGFGQDMGQTPPFSKVGCHGQPARAGETKKCPPSRSAFEAFNDLAYRPRCDTPIGTLDRGVSISQDILLDGARTRDEQTFFSRFFFFFQSSFLWPAALITTARYTYIPVLLVGTMPLGIGPASPLYQVVSMYLSRRWQTFHPNTCPMARWRPPMASRRTRFAPLPEEAYGMGRRCVSRVSHCDASNLAKLCLQQRLPWRLRLRKDTEPCELQASRWL